MTTVDEAAHRKLLVWADRMKEALERIVEGLEDQGGDPQDSMSAREVLAIAERALNPDDWTPVRD